MLFNPWLGFPARNAVYLDRDFNRMRGNGQQAFGTFQTAYTYAAALAASTGELVLIFVGQGTAAQFGNLTLAADYNSSVILVGVSKDLSKLGNITATNAGGDGYNVNLTIANITLGSINTASSAGAATSGAVTITGNGIASCLVGAISANAAGAATTSGAVVLTDLSHTTIRTDALGMQSGNITLTRTSGTTLNARGDPTSFGPATVSLTDAVVTTVALAGEQNSVGASFTALRSRGTTINASAILGVSSAVSLTDSEFTTIDMRGNGDVNPAFTSVRSRFTTLDGRNVGSFAATACTLTDSYGTSINVAGNVGDGGAVTMTRSKLTGALNTSNAVGGSGGTILLDENSTVASIDIRAVNYSTLTLDRGSVVTGNVQADCGDSPIVNVKNNSRIGGTLVFGGGGSIVALNVLNGSSIDGATTTVDAGNSGIATVVIRDSKTGNLAFTPMAQLILTVDRSQIGIVDCALGNDIYTISNSKTGALRNYGFPALIKACDAQIEATGTDYAIGELKDACVFSGVVMKTIGGNAACIGMMVGTTTQFCDTTLIPHGTGAAMIGNDATVEILADNLRVKNDVSSVIVNGQYTINPGYAYPA